MTFGARLLILSLAAFSLAGCSGTRDPIVRVASAALGERTDQAATVRLGLHLENPNSDRLQLLEFDYRVQVNGRTVYEGKRAAQMTLTRLSEREMEIPAVIPFDRAGWPPGMAPTTADVRVNGTLRYMVPGSFSQTLFDTGIRRPSVDFHGEHTVALLPATPPTTTPAQASAANDGFSDAP
jgi:hypothetical protein